MKLVKILFYVLIGLSILGIPVFTFGIINTLVSLKYETHSPMDCISLLTEQDLCLTLQVLKVLIIICIMTIILLIVFRKYILGDPDGKRRLWAKSKFYYYSLTLSFKTPQ